MFSDTITQLVAVGSALALAAGPGTADGASGATRDASATPPFVENLEFSSSVAAGVPMGEPLVEAIEVVEPVLGAPDWSSVGGSCSGEPGGLVVAWEEGLILSSTLDDGLAVVSGWQLDAPIEGADLEPSFAHGMTLRQARRVAPDLRDISLYTPTYVSSGVQITLGQDRLVDSIRTDAATC